MASMNQNEIIQIEAQIKALNSEQYDWTRAYGHFKTLKSSNEVIWIFERYLDPNKTLPENIEFAQGKIKSFKHKLDELELKLKILKKHS